jgi:hypothetical protein
MDPERQEPETLEAAELRKRLLEEAAQEKSHRAAGSDEEARHHGPEPEWRPPKELSGGSGRVLVRFIVFVVLLLGIYFLVRQGSLMFFQPELVALDAVTPQGRIMPGQPITMGVRVANNTGIAATSFVVAALPSGQEVTGTPVEIPGNDTAMVEVQVSLPVGDHVLSLVAFEGGREQDRRLESYYGLNLWVGDREIEMAGLTLPGILQRSDTLVLDFTGTNPGGAPESIVPVLVFGSDDGELTEVDGPVAAIGPGETGPLQITLVGANLDPGTYSVQLLARTPTGERLALQRLPTPVEVRDP